MPLLLVLSTKQTLMSSPQIPFINDDGDADDVHCLLKYGLAAALLGTLKPNMVDEARKMLQLIIKDSGGSSSSSSSNNKTSIKTNPINGHPMFFYSLARANYCLNE